MTGREDQLGAEDRIEPRDWMTAEETVALLGALGAGGSEVRFVGGCVRDALAGRPVKDIDLATPDPPEQVMALLERAGIKAVPTGLDHGTVTAISNHRPYEVTTLRHDVESHGRHATVAFTDDWKADAARRDFTFNAMSCRADGTLFDPFGGRADLAAGRVRFVGSARQRIQEDYLRLLRFFRFHAHYGRGRPDPEGLEAAADLSPGLSRLSGERMREELLRLLEAADPAPVMEIMAARSILAAVLPELRATAVLRELVARGQEDKPDRLLRLAALLEGGEAAVRHLADRLRLSRAERERLSTLVAPKFPVAADMAEPALRVAVYRLGPAVADLLRLDVARCAAAGQAVDGAVAAARLELAETWTAPRFPLKGSDVLDLDIPEGESVGRLLAAVEDWWIDREFQPDKSNCLAELAARAARPEAGI